MTVGDVVQLEHVIQYMSPHTKTKADEKIRLFAKVEALEHEQSELFVH